ncbi:MAG: bifunctional glutamate N-acetyltransferase/amino-acid acetyltransferase ArgJ [Chloroflexota bacterium]
MTKISFVRGGSVSSPEGFKAGAVYAGLKTEGEDKLDLGILYSEAPCAAAGVFTTLRVRAATIVLCQERIKRGKAQAVFINAGVANAFTGAQGLKNAREMAVLAGRNLGITPEDVLVASTGVTGVQLPMAKIRAGVSRIKLSEDDGHTLARAMMTTDRVPKETAVRVRDGELDFTIGGVTKGSGMIHPNLATMLCFIATDASVEPGFLQKALRESADKSFNMITVDGDTSPNDALLLLANGLAGNKPITVRSAKAKVFREALDKVCITLAKKMAADGEGATKLIEVNVTGAANIIEGRAVARTIAGSSLVKTAIYGNDPNWGRIIAAAGRAGVAIQEEKLDLEIGGIPIMKRGKILPFERNEAVKVLRKKEVVINLNVNMGKTAATAWGCDMTEEYVKVNSYYTT